MKIVSQVVVAIAALSMSFSVLANSTTAIERDATTGMEYGIQYADEGLVMPSAPAPLGEWMTVQELTARGVVKSALNINEDYTFSGEVFLDEEVTWTYSGTWEMDGDKVVYTYLQSSKKLPTHYKYISEVVSVDDYSFISKGKFSGKEIIYYKADFAANFATTPDIGGDASISADLGVEN